MNNSMEKLEMLRLQIELDSLKAAEDIVSKAKKSADDNIFSKKQRLDGEFDSEFLRVTESCRAEEKKRVSKTRADEDKKLLIHRSELTERFFAEVEEELKKLAASNEYTAYLKRCAEKADAYAKLDKTVTAYCRPEDVQAAKEALSSYGTAVEPSGDIRLGGLMFSYEGSSACADFTIDTALEQERKNFASVKEMQL